MKHIFLILFIISSLGYSFSATDYKVTSTIHHSPDDSPLQVLIFEHYERKISVVVNFTQPLNDIIVS
jgi:hypothetical protein